LKLFQKILNFQKNVLDLIDFKSIGYTKEQISTLSSDEASTLVSEDGFFGVTNSAQRIASFVLEGANGDLAMLEEGRRGVVEGFNEAKRILGDNIFEISYKTMDETLKIIDEHIGKLGGNILNVLT
jgi:hypothetical protein